MKTFLVIVCGVTVAACVATLLAHAADRQAVVDCLELQKQAASIPKYDPEFQTGFFISQDQKQECDSVNMAVDATVL